MGQKLLITNGGRLFKDSQDEALFRRNQTRFITTRRNPGPDKFTANLHQQVLLSINAGQQISSTRFTYKLTSRVNTVSRGSLLRWWSCSIPMTFLPSKSNKTHKLSFQFSTDWRRKLKFHKIIWWQILISRKKSKKSSSFPVIQTRSIDLRNNWVKEPCARYMKRITEK